MPSGSFYVILNSNTRYPDNKTSAFTVPLAKELQFNSRWCVGVTEFIYPHSWSSLGTTDAQYIDINWKSGACIRLPLPPTTFTTRQELEMQLAICILSGIGELQNAAREARTSKREKRAAPSSENVVTPLSVENQQNPPLEEAAVLPPPLAAEKGPSLDTQSVERVVTETQAEDPLVPPPLDPEMTVDGEETNTEPPQRYYMKFKPYEWQSEVAWTESEYKSKFATFIRRMPDAHVMPYMTYIGFAYHIDRLANNLEEEIRFQYMEDKERFVCYITNDNILSLELSDQLAYILGYSTPEIQNNSISNYPIDLQGGMDSLFIYAPGLVQPSIVSDALAPLLRIVVVRSALNELRVKEEFIQPHLYDLMKKSISEISIEIRTSSGRLVPFKFGDCILTLQFAKDRFY
jgi:hypothetical protein